MGRPDPEDTVMVGIHLDEYDMYDEDGLFWCTLAVGMKPMLFDTATHTRHVCNHANEFDELTD